MNHDRPGQDVQNDDNEMFVGPSHSPIPFDQDASDFEAISFESSLDYHDDSGFAESIHDHQTYNTTNQDQEMFPVSQESYHSGDQQISWDTTGPSSHFSTSPYLSQGHRSFAALNADTSPIHVSSDCVPWSVSNSSSWLPSSPIQTKGALPRAIGSMPTGYFAYNSRLRHSSPRPAGRIPGLSLQLSSSSQSSDMYKAPLSTASSNPFDMDLPAPVPSRNCRHAFDPFSSTPPRSSSLSEQALCIQSGDHLASPAFSSTSDSPLKERSLYDVLDGRLFEDADPWSEIGKILDIEESTYYDDQGEDAWQPHTISPDLLVDADNRWGVGYKGSPSLSRSISLKSPIENMDVTQDCSPPADDENKIPSELPTPAFGIQEVQAMSHAVEFDKEKLDSISDSSAFFVLFDTL